MADSYIPTPEDPEYERDILGFINEVLQESEGFLKAQPNYDKIDKAKRMIHSKRGESVRGVIGGQGLSDVEANHVAKAANQLVSSMTDTRPFWEGRTFNPNLKKQVEIFGKIGLHTWLNRQWDMRWADMIRGCCTSGSSYSHITWNSRIMDLDFQVEDVRDVLPFRPNSYHTIQDAEGVILRRERTVNYGRSRYPEFADWIVPDRDGSDRRSENTRYQRVMDLLASPFRERLFGKKPQKEIPRIPTYDEYEVYLDDQRVNESKNILYMGDWHLSPDPDCPQCLIVGTPHALNNWSYEVKPGDRIYPNKRLIIATNRKVLYDNTSIYWHGMYPFSKLTLDPWDDTFIGKGLIWDVMPMQRFLNRIIQVLDNHFQKWQQPDLFSDKNSVAVSEFNKINTARPGLKVRYNPVAGKGSELRYPDPLPAYFFETLKWSIDEIHSLSGAHDMANLTQLNQLPSADSVERIQEAMTPEVRMRSRMLEAFCREFAMMTFYNIAQFKTLQERIALLGPSGATEEDFDYDPGVLIPDYVFASEFDEEGHPSAEALDRGPMPRYNRAKEIMRQISIHIAPGSLLASSEITDKLMYLQFAREGWIDPQTLADKFGIPNYGQIPGDTIMDRLMSMAQAGMGVTPQQGRPPSGQQSPRIKVSESG